MQELRQEIRLSQQLAMTPQLQQSIKLLQLSRVELIEMVQEELTQNPVLEEGSTQESEKQSAASEEIEAASPPAPAADQEEKGDVLKDIPDDYLTQYAHDSYSAYSHRVSTRRSFSEEDDDSYNLETFVPQKSTLSDHLIWQIQMSGMSERERELATHIVYNLDEDGYLRVGLAEIASKIDTDEKELEEALKNVQSLDPIGVGARTLQECLLIQALSLNTGGTLVEKIIKSCMHELEIRNLQQIAKKLSAPLKEVQQAVKIISGMEPKPGRPFGGETAQYITPDIYVYKVGDDYRIILNEDGIPNIHVSEFYNQMYQDSSKNQQETKKYLQGKIREANWLIKSIERRRETIVRVVESLIKFQRDFFDHGITHLKPLVLRDVAEDLEMHESTISRVTTNKYVYTPQGLFELKFFFSSGVSSTTGGENIASESVKERIRDLIRNENIRKPLSDQEIANELRKDDIDIARRTVAKYREHMSILPSTKRRKLF